MDDNPYLLLTPGPLSTSRSVRQAMLRDWCTWDRDYNVGIVQQIRTKLVELGVADDAARNRFTAVLMQGSGTFSVESLIGSTIPQDGKLLVLANGAYGHRIARIADVLQIRNTVHDSGEMGPVDLKRLRKSLHDDSTISHVMMVHGETTTGMLNRLDQVGEIVAEAGRHFLVDAMSTFGGIPIDLESLGVTAIVSSANKCVQGVPGFGFIIVRRDYIEKTNGLARSLSLDLFDQWKTMEANEGKWRFTSPTHTVRAFAQALDELAQEGGVVERHRRYCENHRLLTAGMEKLGFRCLLPAEHHSPIITAFYNPDHPDYSFVEFYEQLKTRGFVIYPGKVTDVNTFRIGTIGEVYADDVKRLLQAIDESMYWRQ